MTKKDRKKDRMKAGGPRKQTSAVHQKNIVDKKDRRGTKMRDSRRGLHQAEMDGKKEKE